jgi:hypothetical protein
VGPATLSGSLIDLEIVAVDTFASFATSSSVGGEFLLMRIKNCRDRENVSACIYHITTLDCLASTNTPAECGVCPPVLKISCIGAHGNTRHTTQGAILWHATI